MLIDASDFLCSIDSVKIFLNVAVFDRLKNLKAGRMPCAKRRKIIDVVFEHTQHRVWLSNCA